MSARTIALIEDEATIAAAVAARLRAEGFVVEVAHDGPSGVDLCRRLKPDLAVLDVMLPGFDGIEACRRIQKDDALPVIMLTARDSETDMLVGLGVGADDYITKPFSARELVARIHSLLRRIERARPGHPELVRAGDVTIDLARHRVRRAEEEVHLTPTEFDLLYRLASRPGVVFTRDQLLSDVWGYQDPGGGRSVDSHVRALRRKLGSDVVRTVHGIGYAFEEHD
jgi:DNA-binding response OmpR family regulator